MKTIRSSIAASYVLNVLLVSVLFFLSTYFFIGRNLNYLVKNQNQINSEVVFLLNEAYSQGGVREEVINLAFEKAAEYNVGISVTDSTGEVRSQAIDADELVLRLDFAGHLEKEETTLERDRGKVVLTYFVPYFASKDTVKFVPSFLRLALMFSGFVLVYAWAAGFISGGSVRRDLKFVNNLASNIVKGSFHPFNGRVNYAEFQEIVKDLQSLQDTLAKKEHLKKRMTSDFAHELRTPLTTLQTHLEALIDGIWEPTTERFVSCHEEILRLIRLVGDLEKLFRFEDENIVLNKTSFDLTELVRIICVNFAGELSNKNISLEITGGVQEIAADRDKISQVIINLVSNSVKYASPNGKILIDIRGDSYVYLTVNDSGEGIPAKDLSNVFNRFYRSDTSRTRATGGAGIGLTIAKSIVEAHRGSIDIVSQEGLGTEVSVIIPRKKEK